MDPELIRAALHAAVDAFVNELAGSAKREPPSTVPLAEAEVRGAELSVAFGTDLGQRVVRALADAEPSETVSAAVLAERLGVTTRGVLSTIGRAAAKLNGGYGAMPIVWTGSGDEQAMMLDPNVRVALRKLYDMDDELFGVDS